MTLKTTSLIISLVILLSSSVVLAQSSIHNTNNWIPNYSVSHVEHSNGYTLLTGFFDEVGQYTGCHVLLDTVKGNTIDESLPKISGVIYNGVIYAAISDGNGGWYLGGNFQYVDTVKVRNLVHINADKSVDRTWKPTPNNQVTCLALDGTTLYSGGQFSEIEGQTRNYIASFNTTTGKLTSWDPNANYAVEVIKPAGNLVYVGGSFTSIGGQVRNSVAALKSSDGTANTWAPALAGPFGPAAYTYAIEVDVSTNTVYIGGFFVEAGGQSRVGLAQLRTDVALGTATSWNADLSAFGSIKDIVRTGTTLYVAGSFSSIKGVTRQGIAAVSTAGTGAILSWDAQLNSSGSVSDIKISGNSIYLAGYFNSVKLLDRNNLAALNLSNANVNAWAPKTNYSVDVISFIGDKVFLGGGFTTVNAIAQNTISLFDQATGKPWPFYFNLNINAGDKINTIAVKDGIIYIGGKFTTINKQNRNNLAAFDLATGKLLPWNPSVTIFDGGSPEVLTMKIKDDLLYIGGYFDRVNAITRPSLAAINLVTGVPNNWNPVIGSGGAVGGYVKTIDIVGTKVYIGGSFSLVGGDKPRANLAVVDATTGSVFPWAPASAGPVDKIQVSKNAAYVVGDFANGIANGTRNKRIASLRLTSDSLNKWNPQFSGVVNDIVISSTDVYVGGNFYSIYFPKDTVYRPGLASFSLVLDSLNEWTPDILPGGESVPTVNSLSISSTTLFVGGYFYNLGLEARGNYAEYCAPEKPLIILNQSSLSTTLFDSYQWYKGNRAIQGATSQSLDISLYEYGSYRVDVSKDGCSSSSEAYNYLITENELKQESDLIQVFPNPANTEVFIEVPENATLTVVDLMGRSIKKSALLKQQSNKIETHDLTTGTYILLIQSSNKTYHYKLLKTH